MKVCTRCGIEKNEEEFYKQKSNKDGLKHWCKACVKDYKRQYKLNNKDKINEYQKEYQKEWHKNNSDYFTEYYKNNSDKVKEAAKQWRTSNPEKVKEAAKQWRNKNKLHLKDYFTEYCKNKKANDNNFKLSMNLRSRIRLAIKLQYGNKAHSSIELLGCSIEEARLHLESLFQPGMTWENYGMFGWHIDHIIPCDAFDLTNPEEQKKCFHYTNLQPLWAQDNLKKSNKIIS